LTFSVLFARLLDGRIHPAANVAQQFYGRPGKAGDEGRPAVTVQGIESTWDGFFLGIGCPTNDNRHFPYSPQDRFPTGTIGDFN
jgi:hypothetical protein